MGGRYILYYYTYIEICHVYFRRHRRHTRSKSVRLIDAQNEIYPKRSVVHPEDLIHHEMFCDFIVKLSDLVPTYILYMTTNPAKHIIYIFTRNRRRICAASLENITVRRQYVFFSDPLFSRCRR